MFWVSRFEPLLKFSVASEKYLKLGMFLRALGLKWKCVLEKFVD